MTTKRKIELEIEAIKLWFSTFGLPNMSSDSDRVYMSKKLNQLIEKLNNKK